MCQRRVLVAAGLVLLLAGSAWPCRAQGLLAPWFKVAERLDEKRLQLDEARLQADLQRGDVARANRDLEQIQRDQWWLEIDRKGRLFGPAPPLPTPNLPGAGTVLDPRYPAYAQGFPANTQPDPIPQPRPGPSPATPAQAAVTIVNPQPSGVAVNYVVDGATYRTESGGHQRLALRASSTIVYDRGGNFGIQRYALAPGVYEFRPSPAGWALVKLRREP